MLGTPGRSPACLSRLRAAPLCLALFAMALGWAAPADAGPRIASVYSASDAALPTDLKAKLDALKVFDKVDNIDAGTGTPTLMQLRGYDAVLLWSDGRAFFDRATFGNNLSQFVDAGGGVVVMTPYVMYSFGGIGGDFATKYNLTDPVSAKSVFGADIGMKVEAMHPVLAGVNKIGASGNRCIYGSTISMGVLRNMSRFVATLSNGDGLVVVGAPGGRPRVDINLWAASSDAVNGCWDSKGDAAKMIGNALNFVASPLRATPSSIDFGDVGVMTVSAPQTVEVKNTGSSPIVLNSGDVAPAGEFTVTVNDGKSFPITLNAGDAFTFDVRLRPGATGARAATYTVTPAMGTTPNLTIGLRGNGIGPRFGAAPDSINFGGIPFKGAGMTASTPVMVQLKNVGGGQLRLKAIELSDTMNFRLDTMGLMLPNILVGGAFQTVSVTMTPTAKANFTGTLNVTYDLVGGMSNVVTQIPLSGSSGDPKIALPGANITLQPVRVGKTGPVEYITVTNSGLANLSISGLQLSGANAADFKIDSVATMMNPIVVPPGGQSDIMVRVAPTAQGLRRATLTVISDDPVTGMASIIMDSRGTVATFATDRMSIDFATAQQTGTCSAQQTVTVTNTGDDFLTISSVTFDGTNPASFRQPITGSRQVPPGGGKVAIPVTFCPVAIGMQSANLVIATDLTAGHTAKIPLTAVGKGPRLTVTPMGALDFGPVYIKTTSAAKTVTLKNEGDEDIVFGKTSVNPAAAPFKVTAGPAEGFALKPGMTTPLTVTAVPTMAMQSDANLEIVVNDQVIMGLLRVPLSVNGIQGSITVLPKMMMFPTTATGVKSPEQTLSILNSGLAPLTGLSITLSGQNAQDFLWTGDIPMAIAPSQTANFKIAFRPNGNGARSAALVIRATGLAADEQVRLDGTGKSLQVSCSPDFLDFGLVRLEESTTKQVVCQNLDTSPLEVVTAFDDFKDDWKIESEGTTIPAATGADPGVLQLKVTLAPTMEGPRTSNLTISSKDSGVVIASVGLDGNGGPKKMEMMKQGCSVGGRGAPGGIAGLVLLVGLLLRRRRAGRDGRRQLIG